MLMLEDELPQDYRVLGNWRGRKVVVGGRGSSSPGTARNPNQSRTGAQWTQSSAPAVTVDRSVPIGDRDRSRMDRQRSKSAVVRLRQTAGNEQQHSRRRATVIQALSRKGT